MKQSHDDQQNELLMRLPLYNEVGTRLTIASKRHFCKKHSLHNILYCMLVMCLNSVSLIRQAYVLFKKIKKIFVQIDGITFLCLKAILKQFSSQFVGISRKSGFRD